MESSQRPESWADLYAELCQEIAEKLADNEMDHLHFRSICQYWRSSTLPFVKPPLLSLPSLMLPPTPKKPSFIEKTIYLLQIPEDLWELPHMKEFKRSFVVKVSDPFSSNKIRIESLLSRTPLENRENPCPPSGSELSLLNLRVIELCKVFYTPVIVSGIVRLRISRAGGKLTAMALNNEGLLFQYKSGRNLWIQNRRFAEWDDIINYQGQFCAVDTFGRTLLFDSSSFAATKISSSLRDYQNPTLKRLVESCGKLFLVELFENQPKIFRLNMEEKIWIQVENLGDRIFFFADDCSFSLSAREFPECKGNCVYYKFEQDDGNDDNGRLRFCGPSTQVYDLETGSYGDITSFPEHLKIFWPPPKWLEDPDLFTEALFETT